MQSSTNPQASVAQNLSKTHSEILFKTQAKKQQNGVWQGCCPAHNDKSPSLSIGTGKDGRILLTCHTGCTLQAICSALGISVSDLFPQKTAKPQYTIESVYDYLDESGTLLFQTVRAKLANPHECPDAKPKTFWQRRPDGHGGFTNGLKGVRRVLYRLPELLAAHADATIFICEGEKDVDRLRSLGFVATTNPMGAGKWRDEYSDIFIGREVVVLPDNDKPGRDHAQAIANSLHGKASSIQIVELPNLPDGGDASDWLNAGGSEDALCQMIESAPKWTPDDPNVTGQSATPQTSKGKKTDVVELALAKAAFFHDAENKHYAAVKVGSHIEVHPVKSEGFKIWLMGIYFEATGAALYGESLKDAMATLQSIAQFQGDERTVFLRLAEYNGILYLDLCDREWRIVEITQDGWRVIQSNDSPVMFVRRAAMQALPEPVKGGDVAELRKFLNIEDDTTWTLIVSWLVMTFHPSGPYPILSVCGEQGSAKTTACKILRSLIDPNKADLRAVPKDERDLMIAASNSWLLAYDNLSGLSQELSDSLCRVATGAGFATRTLHTDSEETIFSVRRPILTNGIADAANFSDLLDRTVAVSLRAIPDSKRREELELWPAFNEAKARILGALLSAVSHALKHRQSVKLDRRPRMADFARWAIAAETALGLKEGAFFEAYDGNRSSTNEMALDTTPAIEIRQFMESLTTAEWKGKASELFKALNSVVMQNGENPKEKSGWPKAANALVGKLRRIAPNLRAIGIDVDLGRTNAGSLITLKRLS